MASDIRQILCMFSQHINTKYDKIDKFAKKELKRNCYILSNIIDGRQKNKYHSKQDQISLPLCMVYSNMKFFEQEVHSCFLQNKYCHATIFSLFIERDYGVKGLWQIKKRENSIQLALKPIIFQPKSLQISIDVCQSPRLKPKG